MPVFLEQDVIEEQGSEIEDFRSRLFMSEYFPRAKAFPGVRELFERIRADGRRIVLASSCKERELDEYTALAGIADLVDASTTSDDAERSKPHPDIFQAALQRLDGLGPADAIVIGDTPYDAEAARKAGLRTVGVLCGGFPEADLRAAGCVAIYDDPQALVSSYGDSPLTDRG
jgi:HAD superfamily hydrolase (TIGR01509 family)